MARNPRRRCRSRRLKAELQNRRGRLIPLEGSTPSPLRGCNVGRTEPAVAVRIDDESGTSLAFRHRKPKRAEADPMRRLACCSSKASRRPPQGRGRRWLVGDRFVAEAMVRIAQDPTIVATHSSGSRCHPRKAALSSAQAQDARSDARSWIPIVRRHPWRQFGLTNARCQSRLTAMNAEDIASAIASKDPSLGLRAALALHRLAERVEADHVATARQQGWSWQQIGDALGVTRQSVHAKYGKRLP
jgi:hypothetical protein